MPVAARDRALVHGDLGLHNLALDPETDAVNGVFDYDGAAWADRHHDFRYLPFDVGREDMNPRAASPCRQDRFVPI
jgi:aminoglycoside phosphotransferase (APT) family kinase protein